MKKIELPKIKFPNFKKLDLKKTEKKIVKTIDEATHRPKVRIKSIWLFLAALSYLNVLVLIPMIFARKSQFAQFHARQGVALLFLWVLLFFSFYLPFLPFVFAFLILICMIIGVINVITGHERRLPIVGKLVIN